MALRPRDFESLASTYFAIRAWKRAGALQPMLPARCKGGIILRNARPRTSACRFPPPQGSRAAMSTVRNVLFVMCDQLRRDHLSCYGGRVPTPNLDRLAARGVRFDNAFVQSGVCGPSRMSFYTGRYVSSHGATWNRVPLSVAEPTLGDYLRAAGRAATLAGKTHVLPDDEGLRALRHRDRVRARRAAARRRIRRRRPLRRPHAAREPNPATPTICARTATERRSVERLRDRGERRRPRRRRAGRCATCTSPRACAEEHSETAYMTDLALDWIRAQGEAPWVLHLSYVKPHWPYIAPAPYHALYRAARRRARSCAVRRTARRTSIRWCAPTASTTSALSFAREEVARHVRPAYMGLVAQVDHHVGRVLDALEAAGRMRDTLIVFTSDHGEFLGDRGLGEKELFYDEIVRVPFIVGDPDPRADATRGRADARFVEAIDVVPTILDALGVAGAPHRIEGRSLLPLTRGEAPRDWRDARVLRTRLRLSPRAARAGSRRAGLPRVHGAHGRLEIRALAGLSAAALRPGRDPLELRDLGAASALRPHPRGTARAAVRLARRPASDGPRSATRWSSSAPTRIAGTASTSASGDDARRRARQMCANASAADRDAAGSRRRRRATASTSGASAA